MNTDRREWLANRIRLLKSRYILSFWGAVAALLLLQIFGFALLQVFLYYLENISFFFSEIHRSLYLFFLLFLLVGHISFQKQALNNINDFLSQGRGIFTLANKKETLKFMIAFFLFAVWVLLVFGNSSNNGVSFFYLSLFYIFSWAASLIAPKNRYFMPIENWAHRLVLLFLGIIIIILSFHLFGNNEAVETAALDELLGRVPEPPMLQPYTFLLVGFALAAESLVSILFDG